MREAIAEESMKYSSRSPTPCSWRLEKGILSYYVNVITLSEFTIYENINLEQILIDMLSLFSFSYWLISVVLLLREVQCITLIKVLMNHHSLLDNLQHIVLNVVQCDKKSLVILSSCVQPLNVYHLPQNWLPEFIPKLYSHLWIISE
jgi:hypothetical protein